MMVTATRRIVRQLAGLTVAGLAAASLITIAGSTPAMAVSGGSSLRDLSQFPYIGIYYAATKRGGTLFEDYCGTTLISPGYAITAAHCTDGFAAKDISVKFNDVIAQGATRGKSIVRGVSSIILAPGYTTADHIQDLAVLKLSQPVTNIPSAQLDSACSVVQLGTKLFAVGWGAADQANPTIKFFGVPVAPGKQVNPRAQEATRTASDTASNVVLTPYDPKNGKLKFGDSGDGLFMTTPTGSPALVGFLHDFQTSGDDKSGEVWERVGAGSPFYSFLSRYLAPTALSLPSAPSNVSASPQSGGVQVAWTAPSTSGECPIVAYQITWDDGKADHQESVAAAVNQVNLSNVAPGSQIQIAAVTANGVGTDASVAAPSTANSGTSLLVRAGTAAVPAPAQGAVFFQAEHTAVFRSGFVHVTGSADGQTPVNVDDIIQVTVTRPDGTQQSVTHDFSNGCTTSLIPATIDVTPLLQPGSNTVDVTLRDGCGGGVGSTDIYLNADDSALS